jgi:hypothetical protein
LKPASLESFWSLHNSCVAVEAYEVFKTHLEGKPVYEIRLKGYSLFLDAEALLPASLDYPTERHL